MDLTLKPQMQVRREARRKADNLLSRDKQGDKRTRRCHKIQTMKKDETILRIRKQIRDDRDRSQANNTLHQKTAAIQHASFAYRSLTKYD